MLVWCVGAYASGSTWVFNTTLRLMERAGPVATCFVNTLEDAKALDTGRHVVKTHDVPPEVAHHLGALATSVIVTMRDPRDSVTSLMRYQNFSFDRALDWVGRSARFATSLAHRPGVLSFRYEDGFCDFPASVSRIATHLGASADASTSATIFGELSRSAVEAEIGRFAQRQDVLRDPRSGDVADLRTHWHRHHAGRDGAIGRWRQALTGRQAETVRAALADLPELFHPRPLPARTRPV